MGPRPNLACKQGRTALFIAAMTEGTAPIVRMLIAKGADVRGKDAFQNTVLTAATYGNDLDTIRLVLDAGVDVNAAGVTGVTPLLGASYNANLAAVRLFLSKGANANAVAAIASLFPIDAPKSGPIALTAVTPLLAAAGARRWKLVKALLDAGANVNARDGRGMTPLMLAVATNHQDPAVIRLLLARGADATLQSSVGETAADWARKLSQPRRPVAAEGVRERARGGRAGACRRGGRRQDRRRARHGAPRDLQPEILRRQRLRLLSPPERDRPRGRRGPIEGVCASTPRRALARIDMLKAGPPPPLLLERMDINVPEIFASALVALAAENVPPNPVTDMIAAEHRGDAGTRRVVVPPERHRRSSADGSRPDYPRGDVHPVAESLRPAGARR